mmetsp:Transcript_14506/g.30975  ORF Transcript_14506/g.30975 Transcript_14506/m.30975 type:complete len:97 (+) Transcript_14506:847-1137(+)
MSQLNENFPLEPQPAHDVKIQQARENHDPIHPAVPIRNNIDRPIDISIECLIAFDRAGMINRQYHDERKTTRIKRDIETKPCQSNEEVGIQPGTSQ